MSFYECTFIVRSDMSPNDVTKLTDSLIEGFTQGGGSIIKQEYWGLRNLAYAIKKSNKGHYVMLGLDTPYEPLAELERQLRISEDVIRYLTVKVEQMDNKPSVMMRQKSGDTDSDAA